MQSQSRATCDNVSHRRFGATGGAALPKDGLLRLIPALGFALVRSWARAWSRARPWCHSRDGGRRWGSSRCRCGRCSWRRSGYWSRRWSRSRFATWSYESINFVVGGVINATASDNACVPLACPAHHFVRPPTTVDYRPGIAIISMQPLVAPTAGGPNNHVVCAIRRSNKDRSQPSLAHAPGRNDRRRICSGHFVSGNGVILSMKSKICSQTSAISSG